MISHVWHAGAVTGGQGRQAIPVAGLPENNRHRGASDGWIPGETHCPGRRVGDRCTAAFDLSASALAHHPCVSGSSRLVGK